MTAQSAEHLSIELAGFDRGCWSMYGVIRGEPAKENAGWGTGERVHSVDPGKPPPGGSFNWKGYLGHWLITDRGTLVLVEIAYDSYELGVRPVNEEMEGDFYLVLKSTFEAPRTFVPFRAGVIVLDRAAWLHEAYTKASPVATELRAGAHPDFPEEAKLWYELGLPR